MEDNDNAILFIKNPCEEAQKIVVRRLGSNYQSISSPSEEVKKIAIESNPWVFRLIKNPSEKLQKIAIEQDADLIENIKNPSENIQILAVKRSEFALEYIDCPSKEVQKIALRNFKMRKSNKINAKLKRLPTIYYKWYSDIHPRYFIKNINDVKKNSKYFDIYCFFIQ